MKKYNVEHIVWLDHSGGTSGWADATDVAAVNNEDYFVHSVGIVLAENKKNITMVQTLGCNMVANHHITIMKNCIKKRKKLSFVTETV